MFSYYRLAAVALLPFFLVRPSFAGEANASGWLLMPLAAQNRACAAYGDETYQRLLDALTVAQSTSASMLPPTVWAIITPSKPSEAKIPSPDEATACAAAIQLYGRPDFNSQFRQMLAGMFTGPKVLQCMVEQPKLEPRIVEAWGAAMKRNGFSPLDERKVSEQVAHLRKQPKNGPGIAFEECGEVIRFLSGGDFDKEYSEAGVKKLFSGL